MKGGRERGGKKKENPSRERHCKSRHLTRGGGRRSPLIITDTLHYPLRNVHTDVCMCMCVLRTEVMTGECKGHGAA